MTARDLFRERADTGHIPPPLRAYIADERAIRGDGDGPLSFVASTAGIKRDGLDLVLDGLDVENYRKNPVFLWAHDYRGETLPIGTVPTLTKTKDEITIEVLFDPEDDFARQVESKYRRGYLNAVSIGWLPFSWDRVEGDEDTDEHIRVTTSELLDISGVPVPGDAQALIEREIIQLRALLPTVKPTEARTHCEHCDCERAAIPPHTTPTAPEDTAWDGPGEVAAVPAEQAPLRAMHAWIDSEGDPDTKRAYKLPHHEAAGNHRVVWRGVAAAMARLLQAGTQIPDRDRRGVYNHLVRHYRQFDKEAPEFRTLADLQGLDEDTIRGLFLEGELDEDDHELKEALTTLVHALEGATHGT